MTNASGEACLPGNINTWFY